MRSCCKCGAPEWNVVLRCLDDFAAEMLHHCIGILGINDCIPMAISDLGL